MEQARLLNTFGALALATSDAIRRGAQAGVAHGGETAAALNLVGHAPGLHIDDLAGGLGLSHPGTVRLVDRLVADGLMERKASPADRRAVELYLTRAGTRMRRSVLGGRRAATADLLAPLNARERDQLEAIVAKLLHAHVGNQEDALGTCRFCDERDCPDCPVGEALSRATYSDA
jgi:DNA-binding MarR family transcriptional regulator